VNADLMPDDSGFVYVLINPSMEGLVKIGCTARDSAARAKELSSATGVPTPFIVIYESYFRDCKAAEQYIHTLLETGGSRASSNREFFQTSPTKAINAVHTAERALNVSVSSAGISVPPSAASEPWEQVLKLAETWHYGLGNAFVNIGEALKLYKKAARLGSAQACLRIGQLMRHNRKLRNDAEALRYLEQGGSLGLLPCYAELTQYFAGEPVNAAKAWDHFFSTPHLLDSVADIGRYGMWYLWYIRQHDLPPKYAVHLQRFVTSILIEIDDEISVRDPGLLDLHKLRFYALALLDPDNVPARELGTIRILSSMFGYEYSIRLDDGRIAAVDRHEVEALEKGARVMCHIFRWHAFNAFTDARDLYAINVSRAT
jgi:hypothetical protein